MKICLSSIYVVWACSSRGDGKDPVCSVHMCACWYLCVYAKQEKEKRKQYRYLTVAMSLCFCDDELLCRAHSALCGMFYSHIFTQYSISVQHKKVPRHSLKPTQPDKNAAVCKFKNQTK